MFTIAEDSGTFTGSLRRPLAVRTDRRGRPVTPLARPVIERAGATARDQIGTA